MASNGTTIKQFYTTSSPWEARIGHCRAVRYDRTIYVSGSTAADPNSPPEAPRVLFPTDAKEQTRVTLEEQLKAIRTMGGRGAESVVRAKIFVSRKEDCQAVGDGFREVLGRQKGGQIGVAATMIVVPNGFVDKDMLVEVELDAIADAE
ncbi:hypothetical protein FSARC_8516 [Fusarium sarcochroum]|uniref:YjgH family protein n=1 Tax=Fusarium sarcochroum TaxID=1208366 RepID=A0A8H4X676_9HYPO|nr:hypothetical protein FSARC_8516 [Fusarium sarcochroum]